MFEGFLARISTALEIVVLEPLALVEDVSSVKVDNPHVALSAEVFVDQEVFSSDSDANSGVEEIRWQLFNPELEVILELLQP